MLVAMAASGLGGGTAGLRQRHTIDQHCLHGPEPKAKGAAEGGPAAAVTSGAVGGACCAAVVGGAGVGGCSKTGAGCCGGGWPGPSACGTGHPLEAMSAGPPTCPRWSCSTWCVKVTRSPCTAGFCRLSKFRRASQARPKQSAARPSSETCAKGGSAGPSGFRVLMSNSRRENSEILPSSLRISWRI